MYQPWLSRLNHRKADSREATHDMVQENIVKQAGAELCQAQVTLGLAKLDLYGIKLSSSALC